MVGASVSIFLTIPMYRVANILFNKNIFLFYHSVELAVWTHYVATELQPDLLEGLPARTTSAGPMATITTTTTTTNGNSATLEPSEPSDESNLEPPTAPNGNNGNGMC